MSLRHLLLVCRQGHAVFIGYVGIEQAVSSLRRPTLRNPKAWLLWRLELTPLSEQAPSETFRRDGGGKLFHCKAVQ